MEAPLLADAALTMDGGYFLGLLSRVIHTTSAATLLGGLIYMRFVLAPAEPDGDAEAALFAGRRKAWAACVGACTGLLLISGTYNLVLVMIGYKNLPGLYHPLFGAKFLLAIGLMAIMAFVAGKTTLADKMRGSLRKWLNLALALGLLIFLLGGMLRSFRDLPDARVSVPTADEAPAFADDPIDITE
ncbi:hypothetical protein MalM25_11200 [Planctomycetes bacterium MalM25]|nr:hypothetical protein MalM25_11200 [Planctomycetes bacterium MalM25]